MCAAAPAKRDWTAPPASDGSGCCREIGRYGRSGSVFNLAGKNAVVTGASSGIGQAIALAFANAGANVASLYASHPEGATVVEGAADAANVKALMVEGDVSRQSDINALADSVEGAWGSIDIWVNNAGQLLIRNFAEMQPDEWHRLLATNLDGCLYGCQAAARSMIRGGGGRIINVTSVTRTQPVSAMTAYVTGKAGVYGLTVALALELAPFAITVNAIAPGATDTAMSEDAYTDVVRRQYEARIPVGRIASPEDIAPAAVFLASAEAGYVTGHEILVDGGLALNGNVSFDETTST
jgi:NAD(P)-dependent dehydrogenase (short-subunit alcohol dehydrogenase family)